LSYGRIVHSIAQPVEHTEPTVETYGGVSGLSTQFDAQIARPVYNRRGEACSAPTSIRIASTARREQLFREQHNAWTTTPSSHQAVVLSAHAANIIPSFNSPYYYYNIKDDNDACTN